MSGPGRTWWIPQGIRRWLMVVVFVVALAAVIASMVTEATATAVPVRGALWAAAVIALAVLAGLTLRRPAARGAPPPQEPPRLPPPTELIGRKELVDVVVAEARRTRTVIVQGPSGIGASAVAIDAARRLASPDRRLYIDVRAPDPKRRESQRRVAIRVLRGLGIAPGLFRNVDDMAARVAEELRAGGRLLVLDNLADYEQVRWLLGWITGGYVIAAGDFEPPVHLPDDIFYQWVGPLKPDDAKDLLCAQDPERSPPRGWFRRLLDLFKRDTRPGHSIADRMAADPDAERELAKSVPKHPRVLIQIGRWLAANPRVTIRMLVDDLQHVEENTELLFILRLRLRGTSDGARRLLSLLAAAPVSELTEAAAAALAGVPENQTVRYLRELTDRSLIQRPRASRCRVPDETRRLADPVPPRLRAQALVRLVTYLAELAALHAEAIASGRPGERRERAVEWFQAEDVTLLRILGMPDPPRKAAPHLWRIADCLDSWFARERRTRDRQVTAEAMAEAAKTVGDGRAQAVAHLRLSAIEVARCAFGSAWEHLEEAKQADRRVPQYEAGLAVWNLAVAGDLDAAERQLDDCRRARVRGDATGHLIDQLNLAVLDIEKGRLDAADDRLSQVLNLPAGTDPGANAHARELRGVVAWRRGHEDQAHTEWAEALQLYEELGDAIGQARCLLHEGSTLLTRAKPDADDAEKERARHILNRSLELRGSDHGLGVALAHLYLGEHASNPGDGREHRAKGLKALSPWGGEPTEPPQVAAARERLSRLG